MAKIFDNDNSGECVHVSLSHCQYKSFAINLPSQPFLGRHLGFLHLFPNGLLGGHTLFFSWAVLD